MNNTALKITLAIAVTTSILLALVSLVAVSRTQSEFQNFLQSQINLGYRLSPNEVMQEVALERSFRQNLYVSVIIANFIGIIVSIILGSVIARFITKPLKDLNLGIRKLKESSYKFELKSVDDEDFDEVINEFNQLAKELEYLETLRKDLLSDISHEFKTPIASLMGQVQGLKDKVFEPTEERLNIISEQIERLNNLVERLQEYTRIKSKLIKLNLTKVDLNKTVEFLKTYFETENKNKMDIEVNVENNLKVKADKDMIEIILKNLIDNAIKYSGGDKITISADSEKIIVEDNGKGVSEKNLNYLFERFYRVEKSRNRSTGGLGLGLAIVKEIVEAHGWEIKVENIDPHGLRFTISLAKS